MLKEEERKGEDDDIDNDEGDSGLSVDSLWEVGEVRNVDGSMGAALTDIGQAAATNGTMRGTVEILQEGMFDLAQSIVHILLHFEKPLAL